MNNLFEDKNKKALDSKIYFDSTRLIKVYDKSVKGESPSEAGIPPPVSGTSTPLSNFILEGRLDGDLLKWQASTNRWINYTASFASRTHSHSVSYASKAHSHSASFAPKGLGTYTMNYTDNVTGLGMQLVFTNGALISADEK